MLEWRCRGEPRVLRNTKVEFMEKQVLMLGNEAMARGLLEAGCQMATSYPGTPASEIMATILKLKKEHGLSLHAQWAVNEKVAYEIAYAGAMSGLRSAVSMKQVGLNVASDPFMSSAYMGTKAGFVVIAADDPGPHSSQTEQDSRLVAMTAKVPVLDPDSPARAKKLARLAFEVSELFETPVMLRPTTRVCHARQNAPVGGFPKESPQAEFEKNPARWAATPKFRFALHGLLEEKLQNLAAYDKTAPNAVNQGIRAKKAVVASGVASAHCLEIMEEMGLLSEMAFFRVIQPFPLHTRFMETLLGQYDQILVLEETMPVVEMQMARKDRVMGKITGHVPKVGEMLPEKVEEILAQFSGRTYSGKTIPPARGRRPTLCAGCPHRAAFFAIKKAAPKGIYTSDIGCYTLGLNLKAVDTVLCMGAATSQGAGFYHAFKSREKPPPIVATMGDSTFFHAGIPPLVDAVVQKAGIVLVILDNRTTAMTGNQPTPAAGDMGEIHVDMEAVVRGLGVGFCETRDPYDVAGMKQTVKQALAHAKTHGPAVVISRRPCLLDRRNPPFEPLAEKMRITDDCDGCGYCVTHFECPALSLDEAEEKTRIDPVLCVKCKVCVHVCPKGAIVAE